MRGFEIEAPLLLLLPYDGLLQIARNESLEVVLGLGISSDSSVNSRLRLLAYLALLNLSNLEALWASVPDVMHFGRTSKPIYSVNPTIELVNLLYAQGGVLYSNSYIATF